VSQAANTVWDERVERAAVTERVNPVTRRRVRARRLVDGIILMIILAAGATCVSVYSQARAELGSAESKHEAAGEKVQELTIRTQKLERDLQQLRTDSRVIEQLARQKFGFIRSGDVLIKLAKDQTDQTTNATEVRPVRVANLTSRASESYTDASN